MSRVLAARGEQIDLVVLFDSPSPGMAEPMGAQRWTNVARTVLTDGPAAAKPYVRSVLTPLARRIRGRSTYRGAQSEDEKREFGFVPDLGGVTNPTLALHHDGQPLQGEQLSVRCGSRARRRCVQCGGLTTTGCHLSGVNCGSVPGRAIIIRCFSRERWCARHGRPPGHRRRRDLRLTPIATPVAKEPVVESGPSITRSGQWPLRCGWVPVRWILRPRSSAG